MRVEFRVLAYESVEIPDDEANNPIIIEKLKADGFGDMGELMEWLLDHNIKYDYDLCSEAIIGNATAGKLLDDDYILVDCQSLNEY